MKHNTHYNYSGGTGISGKHRARLERDREFVIAYRKVLDLMMEQGVPNPRWAAVNFTIHNYHPRYYVSFDRAYLMMCNIINNDTLPIKPTLAASMWLEIASRVKQLCKEHSISIARATQWVLDNCRSSRFWISPQYAYHNIRHISPTHKIRLSI